MFPKSRYKSSVSPGNNRKGCKRSVSQPPEVSSAQCRCLCRERVARPEEAVCEAPLFLQYLVCWCSSGEPTHLQWPSLDIDRAGVQISETSAHSPQSWVP